MFFANFDDRNFVWCNNDIPCILNPNISIAHALLRSMKLNGSKIAQISDNSDERFTFDEIRLQSIRVAQNLQTRGYMPKQVFGIVASNVAHLSAVVFGSLCLGCPINATHASAEKADMIHSFRMTRPSVIFCEIRVYDLVKECIDEIGIDTKIFTFNGQKADSEAVEDLLRVTHQEEDFIPTNVDGINDIAAIMSSSGTTGKSKQICISHANLSSHLDTFTVINANDIFFYTSTLNWITGLLVLLIGTLNGATRIITTETFSPEMMLRILEKYKVTAAYCSPFYLVDVLKSQLLPKSNLSCVKRILISGWTIPPSIMTEFERFLPNGKVINGYGLTETAAWVTIDHPKSINTNSVGRILNGFTIKIVDEHGKRCGINVRGEICIKDRFKFLGYYGDNGTFGQTIDSEGYFLTGDIGHIDSDGRLYIAERKKDVICYLDWVFPSVIEDILLKSKDIESCCVVGVPYDPIIEIPAAVVVRSCNSKITEQHIIDLVSEHVIDTHKLRGGVYFIDSMPKGVTGKILRRKAKEIAVNLYKMRVNGTNLSK